MNRSVVAGLMLCIATAAAQAQGYPTRPVRVIVQYAAIGPGDAVMRGVAQALTQSMGQSFVIDNRPGADGMIAGEACVKSAPDGYTLCGQDSFSVSLNPAIRLKMLYDPLRDMTPVVNLGFLGAFILVQPGMPANTLRELFELARSKPGTVTWGSWGLSSSPHLYMEWLKNQRGVTFLEVPYKTAPLAAQGLLSGDIQVAVYATGLGMQMVKAGKAKVLANISPARSPQYPDIPTLKEAGLELDIWTWFGLFAPAGTPRDIVQRVNTEVGRELINNALLREKFLTSQGMEILPPAGASPDAFAAFLKIDRANMARIAKEAGIKPE